MLDMNPVLTKKLQDLPQKPGVYMFKDAKGLVLYVGKAVKLKNRVVSYFRQDAGHSTRIQHMIARIQDLDYIVTDNEVESLVLENNFIKQLQPRYNVRMRDDKNYLFIKINIKDEIPTIAYDRKPSDKNARYFGPYTSSISIKDTLRLVRKIFPYCANKKVSGKPCFYYHIGKCPGVCFGKISLDEYRRNYIKNIIQFLEGKQTEILQDLQIQMRKFATENRYEKAAKVRDQIFALNRVLERQKLVYPTKVDQDVVSLHCEAVAVINLFKIRLGKLMQKENFILENIKQASPQEILESFLQRYYLESSSVPKEILLSTKINEDELRAVFVGKKFPKFLVPSRGPKLQLMQLGTENARQYLESTTDKHLLEEARLLASLKELQRVLELPNLPGRIEAYDISNIQGTNPVGSMVVFDFARPKKSDYRKFKINKKQTPDDFAMMHEMLERRFARALPSVHPERHDPGLVPGEGDPGSKTRSPLSRGWDIMPDLILIDGGKGQLSAALSAMQIPNSKFQIPTIGLAKRIEEIFLPQKKQPIVLPPNSVALFLLQRIRDEAHRFAVKYHRHLRSRGSLSSVLDEIGGVGPAKKKLLLQKFGSAGRVRVASLTDLAAIVGSKLAEKIKASL
ncbi:MAG: excinuclease ABC subunit UvrC [Candidatus Doudnabacteria bacterium]|nr:excinuclease ABC subunit UvrC [Candidatus Doudnabacteria bacterium]